jgi:hypothetical protein
MTRTRNDTVKKARDEIIARGGSARQDMISTLMGAILEDMSLDSQQRVKTWIRKDFTTPGYDRNLMATNLEQAYEIQDWMFIFEAATATHLQVIGDVDDCTLPRRQELLIEIVKKLRHDAGTLETWMRKFEDQIRVCEAIRCALTDVHYKTYFMENLNPKIFEDTLQLWRNEVKERTYQKLTLKLISTY